MAVKKWRRRERKRKISLQQSAAYHRAAAWLWRHIKTGGMATGVAKMGGIAKKRVRRLKPGSVAIAEKRTWRSAAKAAAMA
jgi:hypothetical protein